MAVRFQLRRDTSTSWSSINPILALGEPGVETDTLKLKIGDGATAWNSLDYSTSLDFADLQNKPTTLSGYGITDAAALNTFGIGLDAPASGSGGLSYNSSTGTFTYTPPDLSPYITTEQTNDFGDLRNVPTTLEGYGITDAATSAQGALADTALQSVAFGDLTSTPTTLSGYGITDAATSAQGALADTALQSVAFADLTSKPTTLAGYGITDAATSAQGALADTALQSVAFGDLTSTPTTLSGYGITDAATSAQGALADTALQSVAFADLTSKPDTILGYGITDGVVASDLGAFTFTGSVLDTNDSSEITVTPAVSFDTEITVSDVFPSATTAIDLGAPGLRYREIHSQIINAADPATGGLSGDGRVRTNRLYFGPEDYTAYLYGDSQSTWSWIGPMDPGNIFHNNRTYTRWKSTSQKFEFLNNPTGTIELDFLDSDTWYLSQPSGSMTLNFTEVPEDVSRVIVFNVLISQGATPYLPTAVEVNGVSSAINWQFGTQPSGTANDLDMLQFSIWSFSGPTFVVLGHHNTYT